MFKLTENETILDDNYPVYWDYIYIVDNKFIRSDIQGTVLDLRRDLKAREVRRCDLFAHDGAKLGDIVEAKEGMIC